MKIFYTTFICIFFDVYITKAAEEKSFTIDIYLPIFSCLDEFVDGNLFYPVEEGEEYGKIWKDKGYTEDKEYSSLSAESGELNVYTRYGLIRCGKGMSWEDVFVPIYVFKKDNFSIRFFFANTYAYPYYRVCRPLFEFKFVGNINVFCWLGNIKNPSTKEEENPFSLFKEENVNENPLIVSSEKDLKKIVLSDPVEIFLSPGKRVKILHDNYKTFFKEEKEQDPKQLEFDNNIFSFVFLGKDPFNDKYDGVYAKKSREGLTVEQSENDNIDGKEGYFDYFNRKIQSLFDLNKIKNFLGNQKDFLGDKTSSAADDIKNLLEDAFALLKRYSEEKWETKATVLSEVNCCEKCCKNICG